LATTLLGGCAVPSVQLQTMFADSRENSIAALDKYDGRTFRVSGTVDRVGLKTKASVEATFSTATETATARKVARQVPYAVLKSSPGSADSLVCFFEERSDAARLQKGSEVSVEGKVYRVVGGESVLVYMDACETVK